MIFGRRNAPPRIFYPETFDYLHRVGLPRQYLNADIGDYICHSEGMAKLIANYCDNIHDVFQDCVNLTLVGANGSGKTYLGTILLKNAYRSGYIVRRIIFPNFLSDVFSGKESEDEATPMENAVDAEFLLIDEIGKENENKSLSNVSLLEAVLKKREEKGYPTIICTNLDEKGILLRYGPTIHSLIWNQAIRVTLDVKDMREETMRKKIGYQKVKEGI